MSKTGMQKSNVNPILIEIFQHRFAALAEEMGVTLNRTAFSPNIKERKDFSCAVFDAAGDLVAQAAHIPVHLGAMPLSVKAAMQAGPLAEGDMVLLNDPFRGGTHLPDLTLVAPVFWEGRLCFLTANRAHHADIGGMSPGSMPLATTIFQEGIIIPPVKIMTGGHLNPDLMAMILGNVRTPAEREGDFSAQVMANLTGIRRLKELLGAHGLQTVADYAGYLMDYTEALLRAAIRDIPDGVYDFEDVLEDDGRGVQDIRIRVRITIDGDQAHVDFTGTRSQTGGALNAVRAVTVSAVLYVFRCLLPDRVPTNAGCMRPLTITTPEGSVVDARFPAAVAAGNVETSQRIVDVVLGALARALPDRIPAAGQGTMNNITIGGHDTRTGRPFAYYETLGGGTGASAQGPGASAVHSHMTNTLNTPVEALEYSYPLQVERYAVRRRSGGRGRFAGGAGLIREMTLLSDAEVTVISERRRNRPYGLQGGQPGAAGRNQVIKNGRRLKRPGKFHEHLKAGAGICLETPGGGGFGLIQKDEL